MIGTKKSFLALGFVGVLGLGIAARGDAATFFLDDMNLGSGSWTHGGAGDEWEWGDAFGNSCWGTDIDGYYKNDADEWLRSEVIDLGDALSAQLTFSDYLRLNLDSESEDYCYLEISPDGFNWQVLAIFDKSDNHSSWETRGPYDLTDYVGGDRYLQFRLESDGLRYSYGWYIDDVEVSGQLIPEPSSMLLLGSGLLGLVGVKLRKRS